VAKLNSSFWTIAIALSGWIAALFLGILDLPAKINSFFKELPTASENVASWWNLNKHLTGTWTSDIEGNVDATEADWKKATAPGGPVSMRLRVYGGKVEGEIYSKGLEEKYIYSVAMIEGVESGGEVQAIAYDFVGGKKTAIATLRIKRSANGLEMKTVEQPIQFFPDEALLHADENAMDGKGQINIELIQRALKKGGDTKP
jgi:hypothetical protein